MLHVTPAPTRCQPWCTDHHSSHLDEPRCRTRITASYGQLVMTHTPDEGVTITLFSDDGMTVLREQEAKHLAHALTLLDQVANRTAVAA